MTAYTISPVWGAGAQIFDNNGNVLSGGKIYTYEAGTTTPATTYTTPVGNTFNSNPIVANASGRLANEIWLLVSGSYKFQLKDANDVLIATYDNIPTIPQPPILNDATYISYEQGYTVTAGAFTIGATYRITSVGTTNFVAIGAAANVTGILFTATSVGSGTGTAEYSRTVQAKLQESVSVKDFGAVGDGVTDDTAAIQAALNTGKPVIGIGGESYLLSSTLNMTINGGSFNGNGCTFKASNGSAIGSAIRINANDVHVTNYTCITNSLASGFSACLIVNSENSIVDYLRVIGNRSLAESINLNGILLAGGHTKNLTLKNNYIYQCVNGINYVADGFSGNYNKVLENTLIDTRYPLGGTGNGPFASVGNIVSENTVSCVSYSLYMGIEDFSGTNGSSPIYGIFNTVISNNIFNGSLSVACDYFAISAVSKGAIVTGNVITDWYNTSGIISAVELAGQGGITCSQNKIWWSTAPDATRGYGIFNAGNIGYGATLISENEIQNANIGVWIFASGISQNIISNNSFKNLRRGAVLANGGVNNYLTIEGNTIDVTIPAIENRNQISMFTTCNAVILGNVIKYASSASQNTFQDNGIVAASPCIISNNIMDMGGFTFPTSYGVFSNGANTSNVIVTGNSFLGGMGMNYQQFTNIRASNNIVSGSQLGLGEAVLGFYDTQTPTTKPVITGSRGGNAALASLLTSLAAFGLITNSTTA